MNLRILILQRLLLTFSQSHQVKCSKTDWSQTDLNQSHDNITTIITDFSLSAISASNIQFSVSESKVRLRSSSPFKDVLPLITCIIHVSLCAAYDLT